MRLERLTTAEWGDALPDAGFEVFHLPAALEVVEEHAAGELVLLGGFKGERPVGLLPVVVEERSLGRAVLSPPPGLGVPRLGPVLMPASPKRRKRERVNRRFAEAVLEELDVDASLTLFRMVCNADYADPRPYAWADLDLDAAFTYRLDVAGRDRDDLLASFSRSLRREIRDARDSDLEVARVGDGVAGDGGRVGDDETGDGDGVAGDDGRLDDDGTGDGDGVAGGGGGVAGDGGSVVRDATASDAAGDRLAAARSIFEATRERYEEQNRAFRLTWPYVRDLLRALGDRARLYVARDPDGEFVGGVTVLYSNDAAYFWQGGTRASYDGASVNSLLHWRILADLVADPPVDGVTTYDLMGANTERLCRYKSKFGADLVPYYVVESQGKGIDVAKAAYRVVSR